MKKILFILLSTYSLMFAATIGSVTKTNGTVKVKSEGSIKKTKIKSHYDIKAGDLIISSKKASAKIKLIDGSELILAENSSIRFASVTDAKQLSGKVLYKITSRDAKHSLKVHTPFAIIGIKGTTFIVNATQNGSVSLKEGVIGVTSIQKEFKLYRKKIEDEFAQFKAKQSDGVQKIQQEYEKYKNREYQYQEPVITKEFDLKAGNTISFNDNEVKEQPFDNNISSEFQFFEELESEFK